MSQQEAELTAAKLCAKVIDSSAKENDNIELIFLTMIQEIELASLIKRRDCQFSSLEHGAFLTNRDLCTLI